MIIRTLAFAMLLPATALSAAPPAPAPGPGNQRLHLPRPYPYSIEVPAGWSSHDLAQGLMWLGPADVTDPNTDVRVVWVRASDISLTFPSTIADNIKQSAKAPDAQFSAPLVEVRDLGDTRGVLVQMDSGTGATAVSTLVLKMPVGPDHSVDFLARAPRAAFTQHRGDYERMLLSVRHAE